MSLRYAIRLLTKQPGFTLLIVLSISLGIGANATVFAWMESLVLNPYPAIPEYSRLVAINTANQDGTGAGSLPFSYPTYQDWRKTAQSFDGFSAEALLRANLRRSQEPLGEPVWAEYVSGNYFDTLQVPAFMGRAFSIEDERNAAQVAVISHDLWKRRFAGDRAVIGEQVHLNSATVTIIGVAPPDFNGSLVGYGFDLWVPLTLQPSIAPSSNRLEDRGNRWLQGTARLKPAVSLEQAGEELKLIARRVSEAQGERPASGAVIRMMRERFAGSLVYPLFAALLAITGIVLLTACANVANLLLRRGATRQKEIGVRLALGGSRGHIIRQLLAESFLLSILGGIGGLTIAAWLKDVFYIFIPPTSVPVALSVTMNWRIMVYAFVVTMITAVISGLFPALKVSGPDLVSTLKAGGRSVSGSRSLLRSTLIVAQVAFSVVALVSAGLFLRSLQQAQEIDVGFTHPEGILLIGTDLSVAGITPESGLNVSDALLQRVRELPGVTAASLSTMVPLGFGGHRYSTTQIEGYVTALDEQVSTERVVVSDGYFETMGMQILRGRGITRADLAGGQSVAVVNETLANRYWPGQDPLGKRLNQGFGWAVVVGLAKDGKYRDLNEKPSPVVYSPLTQNYTPAFTLHLRTAKEPRLLIEATRRSYAAVNENLPFFDPRTLAEHIQGATLVQVIGASMLSGFATLALLLATIGLYGVLAYSVSERTGELAIRMAVGATSGRVVNMVLQQGLRLTLAGVLIGLCMAAGAASLLRSQLLEVRASDPLTYAGAIVLCLAITLIACALPAWKGTKVDPSAALHRE